MGDRDIAQMYLQDFSRESLDSNSKFVRILLNAGGGSGTKPWAIFVIFQKEYTHFNGALHVCSAI